MYRVIPNGHAAVDRAHSILDGPHLFEAARQNVIEHRHHPIWDPGEGIRELAIVLTLIQQLKSILP